MTSANHKAKPARVIAKTRWCSADKSLFSKCINGDRRSPACGCQHKMSKEVWLTDNVMGAKTFVLSFILPTKELPFGKKGWSDNDGRVRPSLS